jgi:hypothetical protein
MARAHDVTVDDANNEGAIVEPPREPVPQAGSPLRVETRAGAAAADVNVGGITPEPRREPVPQAGSSIPTDAAPSGGNA